ncbi:MAG: hypothetical protein ACQSGP_17215 [Frankia sp.]
MSMLGWRQWAVDERGGLRPAWTPWSPFPDDLLLWRPDGLTRALCLRAARDTQDPRGQRARPAHVQTPDEACVCGLYAWRDPDLLTAAARPRWTHRPIVVGVAKLGGRVIVTERGYRAELATPVAVLDRHGVVGPSYRVARYRHWDALVAEWGASPAGQQ